MNLLRALISAVFLLSCLGCASSPQLYPNKKYQDVGKDQANQDIQDCQTRADNYVSSGKGRAIASDAGAGAVVGSAAGAVLGLFSHNVAMGALEGGGAGAAGGAAAGAMSPDQVKRNFVNQCLKDRGYQVIGWN